MDNIKNDTGENGKHISKFPKRKFQVCQKVCTLEMDASFSQAVDNAATKGLLLMGVLPTKQAIFDEFISNNTSLVTKLSCNFLIWKPNKETFQNIFFVNEHLRKSEDSCKLISFVIDPSSKKILIKFFVSPQNTFESQLTTFLHENKSITIDDNRQTCKKQKLNEDSLNFDKVSQSLDTIRITKNPLKRKLTINDYQELCSNESKRPKYKKFKKSPFIFKDDLNSSNKNKNCFSQQIKKTKIKKTTYDAKNSLVELKEKEKQKQCEFKCCNIITFSVIHHSTEKPRFMWKFSSDDTVESLLIRMEQDGYSRQNYDLMAHFPMRNISKMYQRSKLSTIFSKNELIFVKEKYDEDSD